MTDATQEQNQSQQKSKSDKEEIDILIKSFPGCKPCDSAHDDAVSGKWDPDDEFKLNIEKKEYLGGEPDNPILAPEIKIESKCRIMTLTGYGSPEDMRELLKEVSCKTIDKKVVDKDGEVSDL